MKWLIVNRLVCMIRGHNWGHWSATLTAPNGTKDMQGGQLCWKCGKQNVAIFTVNP